VDTLKDYAEHAHSCREAASKAANDAERDHLLEMAKRWEELARQRAAHLHLEHVLDDLLKPSGNHDNGTAGAA
jgi:hypothetical protein